MHSVHTNHVMKKIIIAVCLVGVGIAVYMGIRSILQQKPSVTETSTLSSTSLQNITVTSPRPGDTVGLPFLVQGEARVFESVVRVRLRAKDGTILFDTVTMAQAPDTGQFGAYTVEVGHLLVKPTTPEVFIEVFDNSPKDGSEIDLVAIPVKLSLSQTMYLKVFFAQNDCDHIEPVMRIVTKTQAVAYAAIDALLIGPSPEERRLGFTSMLNSGTKILGLSVGENGIARVNFDKQLEFEVGGACRVTAIREQITKTLKQFPTVKNVVISIDGRTEDILQP